MSLQGPTITPHQESTLPEDPSGLASLISTLKKPRHSIPRAAAKQLDMEFATHPEIAKLRTLSEADYINHVNKLKQMLTSESGDVKYRFSTAMVKHMKKTNVPEKQQNLIRAKVTKTTRKITDTKSENKRKAIDPEKFKAQRRAINARSRAKVKQRQLDIENGKRLSFEEQLKAAHVSDDATASDIEVKSRHLLDDQYEGTAQLRKYLLEKGVPLEKVKHTIAVRSHYAQLKNAGFARERTPKKRKTGNKRKMKKLYPDVGSKGVAEGGIIKGETSDSHDATSSGHSHHLNVNKSDEGPFYEGEWWKDLYQ